MYRRDEKRMANKKAQSKNTLTTSCSHAALGKMRSPFSMVRPSHTDATAATMVDQLDVAPAS